MNSWEERKRRSKVSECVTHITVKAAGFSNNSLQVNQRKHMLINRW